MDFSLDDLRRDETYTPADICAWFSLARTTLFRWEAAGLIPKADRRGTQRIYTRRHVAEIANQVREKLKKDLQTGAEHNPDSAIHGLDMQEQLYRLEFLAEEFPIDALLQLSALSRRQPLSAQTVDMLTRYALRLPSGHLIRLKVWRILLKNDLLEFERTRARPPAAEGAQ